MGISRTGLIAAVALALLWPLPPSRAIADGAARAAGIISGVATTKEAGPRPIRVTIDPQVCGQSLPDESILVDADGHLANVVLTIAGVKTPAPAETFVSNEKCAFVPRVSIMDATPRRYQTFADLEPYCHRVASSVGLMCAEIFGYRERAVLDYARDLGVALQLTNILRDVAVDYRVGRFYLPAADLATFGASESDVREEVEHAGSGVRSEEVRRVLEHHASRARDYFGRAVHALPRTDASRFVAAEIMPFIALINPQITPVGDEIISGWEGCLSIPDIRGLVPRASRIQVKAYDRNGRIIELAARGLPARVIQHETDHLDGILFFDRMNSFESLTFSDEYRRYWTEDEDD